MGYALTIAELIDRAGQVHDSLAKLARPGWLFERWRERRFARTLEDFLHAMHHVPRTEAQRAAPDDDARLRGLIDAIIEDVERFLSSRPPGRGDALERNQQLASRVYDLRQAFEAIARGATPNPHIVDVRREERLKRPVR